MLAADKDGALHEETSTDVRFVVTAHATELNVWDVPSTIVSGGRFKFMVGFDARPDARLAARV